jgi:hypothetical protein
MINMMMMMMMMMPLREFVLAPSNYQLVIIVIIAITIYIDIFIAFMQGIYNCISQTNHVSMIQNVAAVLYLLFLLHVMLFRT